MEIYTTATIKIEHCSLGLSVHAESHDRTAGKLRWMLDSFLGNTMGLYLCDWKLSRKMV